jgi:excisionase family DNA binding protein
MADRPRPTLDSFPGDVVTVPEAAQVLGIGRNLAYELVAQGKLRAVRLGRRLIVPKQTLRAMLCLPVPIATAPAVPTTPLRRRPASSVRSRRPLGRMSAR